MNLAIDPAFAGVVAAVSAGYVAYIRFGKNNKSESKGKDTTCKEHSGLVTNVNNMGREIGEMKTIQKETNEKVNSIHVKVIEISGLLKRKGD